jgi:hypothetical protein
MLTDYKTAHRSKEWKEGWTRFFSTNNPAAPENNPYPFGSRQFSEYQQGFLTALLDDAQDWTTRSGVK